MSRIYVARKKERKGLYLPMGGTKDNPALMFLLPKMDRGQLDEMIRKQLEKVGITKESDVQAILDKAETDYEFRIKVEEAKKEIRRLMDIKRNGGKLMSVGHKKWRQAFYPAVSKGV